MKSNLLFFAGLFSALLVSWLGVVVGANAQLGSLAPYYDDNDGSTHPEWLAGVAAQGQLVYKDLGCVACHTQQVRRPSFGSDQARGWGDRQSVARDYIYQPSPQLGLSRVGPDLTNVGDRKPPFDRGDFLNLLYAGATGMPSYRFLFEARRIGVDAQPADNALKLTGALRPPAGWEVVPTERAESLVGYLVNLKSTYTYPEAAPFVPPKAEGEAGRAPAAAAPAPAAAPKPDGEAAKAPAAGATPAPAAAPKPDGEAAKAPAAPPAAAAPGAAPAAAGAPPAPALSPTPSTSPAAGAPPGPAQPGAPASPGPVVTAGSATGGPVPAQGAAPAAGTPVTGQSGPPPVPASAPSAPAAPLPGTTPPAGAAPTPSPTGGHT